MKKLITLYFDSFRGLSREVWVLALITLINRAGTMVIPFLSLYLAESKGFSLTEIAWIMSAFGLGSVAGSWLGGFLNDRVGYYKAMVFSLLSSGIMFILVQYGEQFWAICSLVFLVILFADIFRPAMFVALKAYSKVENQTRSLSLIRLAINLGFAVGPAIAGFLIYNWSYSSLFWVDGVTCFAAALVLLYALNPKKSVVIQEKEELESPQSAYKDGQFMLFFVGMMCMAFVFLQYFSTVPLYYSQAYGLSEEYIGLILGFNGFLVFVVEMPLMKYLEKSKKAVTYYVIIGMLLLTLSFAVLNVFSGVWVLWVGIALMSFSEIYAFPFSNKYAMNRSKRGKAGQYMALYSISFSVAHIIGHNTGFQLIEKSGYNFTWWIMTIISLLGVFFIYLLYRQQKLKSKIKI